MRADHPLLDLVHAAWTGDLDGMLERRLLRALIVPSRTMYFFEKGEPKGMAAEYQVALEAYINKRFPPRTKHLKTNVVLVPTPRVDLIPALLEGRGDVAAANLTITAGREELIDFTAPTAAGVNEIVITGPSSPAFSALDDLAGNDIAARRSSSYWEHLQGLNKRFKAEGKKQIRLVPVPEELEDEDLMEMVHAGLLQTIVADDYKGALWSSILPNIELHPDLVVHSGGQFAWMIRKNSPGLKTALDAFIEGHKSGTSFGNTVIRRYTGSTKFVKPATSAAELAKFDAVIDLFRRYSDQYDLDPLLLVAQGYQESGLEQRRRSRAGAVGIMQVLPSTAEELGVGDVHQLEPNIHAGAKYIRQIIDTHFTDASINALNKTLFAFAAYNAGPYRVSRLRATTRERGLNPDEWFDNVEFLVAETVGAETTRYVSNIFKYYVAFKLIEQHREAKGQAKEAFTPSE